MTTDIHNIIGNARHGKIANDPDEQEDQVSGIFIASPVTGYISALRGNDHIFLDLGNDGSEDIGHG